MTVQKFCASRPQSTPSGLRTTLIILALACGAFGIGVGEFAIMALLPEVATSFRASVPEAGYMITAYAAGVVIGAPLIAVAAARLTRRRSRL